MDKLRQIAGERPLRLVSIQGLHRFYARGGDVAASWMTREDRELAIADNISYVAAVLAEVAGEFGLVRPMLYVGFSQGVAMAYRAAAFVQYPCDGIVALGGDLPPDVAPVAHKLPRTLIGRGMADAYYTEEKIRADLAVLEASGVACAEHVFDGGHEWAPTFVAKAAEFLDAL